MTCYSRCILYWCMESLLRFTSIIHTKWSSTHSLKFTSCFNGLSSLLSGITLSPQTSQSVCLCWEYSIIWDTYKLWATSKCSQPFSNIPLNFTTTLHANQPKGGRLKEWLWTFWVGYFHLLLFYFNCISIPVYISIRPNYSFQLCPWYTMQLTWCSILYFMETQKYLVIIQKNKK